jgi:hypothetical protein
MHQFIFPGGSWQLTDTALKFDREEVICELRRGVSDGWKILQFGLVSIGRAQITFLGYLRSILHIGLLRGGMDLRVPDAAGSTFSAAPTT